MRKMLIALAAGTVVSVAPVISEVDAKKGGSGGGGRGSSSASSSGGGGGGGGGKGGSARSSTSSTGYSSRGSGGYGSRVGRTHDNFRMARIRPSVPHQDFASGRRVRRTTSSFAESLRHPGWATTSHATNGTTTVCSGCACVNCPEVLRDPELAQSLLRYLTSWRGLTHAFSLPSTSRKTAR